MLKNLTDYWYIYSHLLQKGQKRHFKLYFPSMHRVIKVRSGGYPSLLVSRL
jgi:hypothetical protein